MEEIYQNYASTVYKYLFSKTHSQDTAEELTQETFYQAVKSIDRYDGSCAISTWLCAIAKNQLCAYIRKHPQTVPVDDSGGIKDVNAADDGLEQSAESAVIGAMDRVELLRRFHLCPEPYREILYLRIFGNLSFKEIGAIMGETENWARVTFYRGKGRLRKEIVEDEE